MAGSFQLISAITRRVKRIAYSRLRRLSATVALGVTCLGPSGNRINRALQVCALLEQYWFRGGSKSEAKIGYAFNVVTPSSAVYASHSACPLPGSSLRAEGLENVVLPTAIGAIVRLKPA